MLDHDAAVIACDESGNDGENVSGAVAKVLSHGSTTMTIGQAHNLVTELRRRTGTQAPEMKAKQLLTPKNRAAAQWFLRQAIVRTQSLVALLEKDYFLTCKLIDLTLEEHMHARGFDLHTIGDMGQVATWIHDLAPQVFGNRWTNTLETFNGLLRCTEQTQSRVLLKALRGQLSDLAQRSVGLLADHVRLMYAGTRFLPGLNHLQTKSGTLERFRTLDPLICIFGLTVHHWSRVTGRELVIVHDRAKVLTQTTVEILKVYLAAPELVSAAYAGRGVVVRDVVQVDSAGDPRVQIADLLAGIGRSVAEAAIANDTHPLLEDLRPMIRPEAQFWGAGRSRALLDPQALAGISQP